MQFVKLREQKIHPPFQLHPKHARVFGRRTRGNVDPGTNKSTNIYLKGRVDLWNTARVLDCGLYFMVRGCKYAAWQDNLPQDQTGSGYCTFYLDRIKPSYAEWSFLAVSKLEIKIELCAQGQQPDWLYLDVAEPAIRCDEGAPNPISLVRFCPKSCVSGDICTDTFSHSSAVTTKCYCGAEDGKQMCPGQPLTGDKTALKSCACLFL